MCDCGCEHDDHKHDADELSGSEDEDDVMPKELEVNEEVDITADGGVKKKLLAKGDGWAKPPKGSEVHVHYVGTLLDGTVFDSSRERGEPFVFKLGQGQVIKGWDLGVATMKKGEKALLTCKPEYAYGSQATGKIPANATLQFEVELLSWVEETDVSLKRDGSVMKKITKEGENYDTPSDGSSVTVDYTISVGDKVVEEHKDAQFVVGDEMVLQGVDEMVQSMKKHEEARAVIKAAAAYGAQGCADKGVAAEQDVVCTAVLKDFVKPKASYELKAEELIPAAEAARQEGNKFYTAKRVTLAEKRYKRALGYLEADYSMNAEQKEQAKKQRVPCHLNIAACEMYLKNYRAAVEACDKALAIESHNVKALLRKGKALYQMREWEDAKALLETLAEDEPDNAEVKKELAVVRKAMHDDEVRQRGHYKNMFARLHALEEEDAKAKKAAEEEEEEEEEEKRKQQEQAADKKDEAATTQDKKQEPEEEAKEESKSETADEPAKKRVEETPAGVSEEQQSK